MGIKKYTLRITLLSDTLIGHAEGFGAAIDKDSVFDEVGLPFIPGKRIKGLLREQADLLDKHRTPSNYERSFSDIVFGLSGKTETNSESMTVSNFTLPEYKKNRSTLAYLIEKNEVSRSEIQEYFTSLRMMTSIDENGIAKPTSLRTFRVLKKGLVFQGEISFEERYAGDLQKVVALTRRLGSSRNRGLGHITCSLEESNHSL